MERPLNYHAFSDRLATSGQPTKAQLHQIADEGYEVVINLAMHDSENALPDEGSMVASLGMNYVNIPVPFDEPEETHLRQFAGVMAAFEDSKVWVHCAVNARVSAFMYQYLTQVKGVDPEAATSPLLVKWRPKMDAVWQDFMTFSVSD